MCTFSICGDVEFKVSPPCGFVYTDEFVHNDDKIKLTSICQLQFSDCYNER